MIAPSPSSVPVWVSRSVVVALTAMAYAATGWIALKLVAAAGWAAPIYPAAGIALASVAVFGWPAALGVGLGAFAVNLLLAQEIGSGGTLQFIAVPACVAAGAMLQALLARALLQRTVGLPLTLREPKAVLRFGFFGAAVACLLNASLATAALGLSGNIAQADLPSTWWTWWVGDTLGVLVGAPIALSLIGVPRDEWAPRRLSVGLPMLLGLALLVMATQVFHRWEAQRLQETFAHSADSAAGALNEQLDESVYALHAVHGMLASHPEPQRVPLQPAADWWLQHAPSLRAIGVSERVERGRIAEFESELHAQGQPGFRVFDRGDGGAGPATETYVVAIRAIEPAAGNARALGVNAMSIPIAREAMLAAAATGQDASTRAFKLTQARREDELGVVVYRALYRGKSVQSQDRLAQWVGVVFVTIDLERALAAALRRDQGGLHGCLIDASSGRVPTRVAGVKGCELGAARAEISTTRPVAFADKRWTLQVSARALDLPGGRHTGSWLFSVVGIAATSLLGALLLTVTGRTRRIELAVDERTQALSQEVRERRSAEDALRDSEQRLRSIVDHVPIGVVFMDARGGILEVNPSLCRMLDRTAAEFRQLTVAQVLHPDERGVHFIAANELLAGKHPVVRRQMRLMRRDGSYLTVQASLSSLRDPTGQTTRMVGVVEDITEHLRLAETERARDAAEAANHAKGEFVSRMSHELRTPLNAMMGFAQLLGMDRRPALAPHQAAWTAQIQHAGWHLLDMINDTLDMSRVEAGLVQLDPQALDLAPMVDASIAMLGHDMRSHEIRVRCQIEPDAQRVVADETRLKQVLTNLLSNAVKYNRDGGEVVVTSRAADDNTVEIEVIDNGLGMSEAQVGALFQPYNRLGRERSAIEGTGIGLVISRRLTELMGGSLDARSVEGHGSVFILRLPRAHSAGTRERLETTVDDTPAAYRHRLVHYIEDNETNIEVMRGILAQRPQVAMEVSMTGLDGLAAVHARRPDLILLDMHLPDVSGLELLRQLKTDIAVADIPVLVLSADATQKRIEEALTLGAVNYLTKPVDVVEFTQVLDSVLGNLDTRWGSI